MPNDIHVGPITFHMYGLMIAIGYFLALKVCEVRAGKRDLNKDVVFDIFMGAVFGGLLGTRIVYYIVSIPEIIKNPSILWDFSHGYVVYGGIIGGILAGMFLCKRRKVRFLPYFDLVMPAVAMAQGFGRIGCFFAGCCYGIETNLPIGFTYKTSQLAPVGVKLMPTQIFSSVGDFLIFFVLLLFAKKKRGDGQVAGFYFILYGIGRFLIEFLRNDHRGSVGIISTSQFISIPIVIIGLILMMRKQKEGETNEKY